MSIAIRFADMPAGVRNRWFNWAASHDWGGEAPRWNEDGTLAVSVAAVDKNGVWFTEHFDADTPKALRDWAGY